jgi:hypothetical protein
MPAVLRHLRAAVKWALTLLLVLVLAAWTLSAWWRTSLSFFAFDCYTVCEVQAGLVTTRVTHRVPASLFNLHTHLETRRRALVQPIISSSSTVIAPPAREPLWRWWYSTDLAATSARGWSQDEIALPLWPAILLLLILTLVLHYEPRAKRRQRLGQCLACGYDRRGLPDGAKCPECGAVPIPAA